jgi:hypothetical protein
MSEQNEYCLGVPPHQPLEHRNDGDFDTGFAGLPAEALSNSRGKTRIV